jgi:ATP-binding cassette subfamily B protein
MPAARGDIVFEGVTFRYGQRTPLFEQLSLRIEAGEHVALVGATGSGKSTFVKLLQRLYDIESGEIRIDGVNIGNVEQASLRRQVAIVPQEPALFHRTLAENIAYGRPESTEAEIIAAARKARAHDFIMASPNGYGTLVGERGLKLSGGERQRVAIARAFLSNAPIVVFDEATASLDTLTERMIQEAMQELMEGRTTVIIAHRLSTVRKADRIMVFDGGRIVEEGRHSDLVQRPHGLYRRLVGDEINRIEIEAA